MSFNSQCLIFRLSDVARVPREEPSAHRQYGTEYSANYGKLTISGGSIFVAQVAKFATPYPPPKPLDYKETGGADRSLHIKTFCARIARFPALD
jgi:hypothetical protein